MKFVHLGIAFFVSIFISTTAASAVSDSSAIAPTYSDCGALCVEISIDSDALEVVVRGKNGDVTNAYLLAHSSSFPIEGEQFTVDFSEKQPKKYEGDIDDFRAETIPPGDPVEPPPGGTGTVVSTWEIAGGFTLIVVAVFVDGNLVSQTLLIIDSMGNVVNIIYP
jgi:hypothetical protein